MKRLVLGILSVSIFTGILSAYEVTYSGYSGNLKIYQVTCNNGNSVQITKSNSSYNPYQSSKFNNFSSFEEAVNDSCR